MGSKFGTTKKFFIVLTLIIGQPIVANEDKLIDPFDSDRLHFTDSSDKPTVDDSNKICKDRWFNEIEPDYSRAKQHLENFELKDLTFTGTIDKQGILWALIETSPKNGINRVRPGNYIGQRHGVVREVHQEYVVLTEIVRAPVKGDEAKRKWVKKCSYLIRVDLDPSNYQLPEFP